MARFRVPFRFRFRVLTGLALSCTVLSTAWARVGIAGVVVDETVIVAGKTLTLNGGGYRKRGYFRTDVTALYTQQPVRTIEALEKAPGPKRIELVILQDISGSQASRYFLMDFEASVAPGEFSQLIQEVSEIGSIYSALGTIRKGDVVTFDCVPGRGMLASMNGTPLMAHGASSPWFTNELLSRLFLRMYVAGKTSAELRDNLLGLSSSMRDAAPASR